MIKRTVDVSQQSYLHVENKQLLIDRDGNSVARVPIEDLGILILQHPAIVISQQLVIACQKNNTIIVFCDNHHLPYSVILPIGEANSLHNKVLRKQVELKKTIRKNLWQQIVVHKIQQQALTLQLLDKNSKHIERLATKVKTADSENHEAQAARQYWQLLMGKDFRRNTDLPGINALLNYGYAIMRSMVARALVGAGLHPALGLHHCNQYNSLCLADDLMEPFRPWVDYCVYQLKRDKRALEVNRHTKSIMLALLGSQVNWRDKKMPLMVACHYLCANLKESYSDNSIKLDYPLWEMDNRL